MTTLLDFVGGQSADGVLMDDTVLRTGRGESLEYEIVGRSN